MLGRAIIPNREGVGFPIESDGVFDRRQMFKKKLHQRMAFGSA